MGDAGSATMPIFDAASKMGGDMATVSGGAAFSINFKTLDVSGVSDYDHETLTSTSAKYFDNASNYTLFKGTGFKYDNGSPTAGTVTSISNVANGSVALKMTGIHVAATSIAHFVQTGDTTGFLKLALAGSDTLNGTA